MDWTELKSQNDLDVCLNSAESNAKCGLAILKHSSRCALSSMVKNRLEKSPDSRLKYFIVDVIEHRELSNLLAQKTHVDHESPQLFLYTKSGKSYDLLDVKSHLAINSQEITRRLDTVLDSKFT